MVHYAVPLVKIVAIPVINRPYGDARVDGVLGLGGQTISALAAIGPAHTSGLLQACQNAAFGPSSPRQHFRPHERFTRGHADRVHFLRQAGHRQLQDSSVFLGGRHFFRKQQALEGFPIFQVIAALDQ